MVCKDCGRRYASPAILETGECPRCGGELVPLEEAPPDRGPS
jgi:rRNA maturation endonuclease Nob1